MNFNQYSIDENGVGTPVSPIEITEADYYTRHSDGLNWGDYLTLQRIAFDEWAKSNTIQTDALAGAYNKELFKKGWQFYADAMDGWHKPLNGMQRKEMQKTRDYWYFIDKGVKEETPESVDHAASVYGNRYYSMDKPADTYTFHEGFKAGAKWQSAQLHPELTRLKALVEKYEKAVQEIVDCNSHGYAGRVTMKGIAIKALNK